MKFAKSHEWVKVDSDRPKEATIGITDFAQKALGDLVFVELPEKGKNLKKEVFFQKKKNLPFSQFTLFIFNN